MIADDFPIAIIILPQLASSPAIAVLTSKEFAALNATFFAFRLFLAPNTSISISFFAPSPSITIFLAN